jgi:hypothetical protein
MRCVIDAGARRGGQPLMLSLCAGMVAVEARLRSTDAKLREHIDAAMKTAASLLADNYLAQDRRRLIRCIELLDEANKAIDGGMWVCEEREETRVVQPAAVAATKTSNLIARTPMAPTPAPETEEAAKMASGEGT